MTTTATQTETRTDLARIAQPFALAPVVTEEIITALIPHLAEAGEIAREAEGVIVTDATQVTAIKQSRALRLKIAAVRIAVEKKRKGMKEEYLRPGQFIDAACKHVAELIEPHEARLKAQEEFAERAEAARIVALKTERENALKPYGIDTSFYQLGHMPAAQFGQLLESTRVAHQAKIDAAAKAEADRIAAEKARAEEEAKVRAENARLQQEAAAREAEAKAERDRIEAERKAEREKAEAALAEERRKAAEAAREAADRLRAEQQAAEAVARKEREAREALEREQAQARAKEAARIEAEKKAAAKAAAAPDQEKLMTVARNLRGTILPAMATDAADELLPTIRTWIDELADRIEAKAKAL